METDFRRRHFNIFHSISTLLHTIGVLNFSYALFFTLRNTLREKDDLFKSLGLNFKYFGSLNGLIQLTYFTIALVGDVMTWASHAHDTPLLLITLTAYLRGSLAFPVGTFTALLFIVTASVDRKYIYSKESIMNNLLVDHMLHTASLILLLIDIVSHPCEPPKILISVLMIIGVNLFHDSFVHVIQLLTNIWVYQILELIQFVGKLSLYVLFTCAQVLLFYIGYKINSYLWDDEKTFNKFLCFKCTKKKNIEELAESRETNYDALMKAMRESAGNAYKSIFLSAILKQKQKRKSKAGQLSLDESEINKDENI